MDQVRAGTGVDKYIHRRASRRTDRLLITTECRADDRSPSATVACALRLFSTMEYSKSPPSGRSGMSGLRPPSAYITQHTVNKTCAQGGDCDWYAIVVSGVVYGSEGPSESLIITPGMFSNTSQCETERKTDKKSGGGNYKRQSQRDRVECTRCRPEIPANRCGVFEAFDPVERQAA
jgi:hypothetical protein